MRDQSLFYLFSPITRLKGVGGATAKALERLLPAATALSGNPTPTVRDLLFHLPTGLLDRRFTCPLQEAPDGVIATFVVTVGAHHPPAASRYSKKPYKVECFNDTGDITLTFFNAHTDYIKQVLPEGSKRVISGRTEHFDYHLQMSHPDVIATVDKLADVQKPEPVYPLTLGMTSRRINKFVDDAIAHLPELPEWIDLKNSPPLEGGVRGGVISSPTIAKGTPHPNPPPQGGRGKNDWPKWKEALSRAHHPLSDEDLLPTCPTRTRLAYDEMLAGQLQLALLRRNMQQQPGEIIKGTGTLTAALLATLPFKLTHGQEQVLQEIYDDMQSGRRMGRLLQGDVGSGKTVVALLAMLRVIEQGFQTALMVPTEIIAQQHFETISKLLASMPSPLEGEGWEGGETHSQERGYEEHTLDKAKALRTEMTDAERKLWDLLRRKQLEIHKFRRQQPIGPYIVDFFCSEQKLIIEADGGQHADQKTYDDKRTRYLQAKGYRVLRFWNNDILQNIEGVYRQLLETLKETPPPTPSLKGRGKVKVVLLTGSVKGKQREKVLADIASGDAQIIIGTHALFQEHVSFRKLVMVTIDEQHRFGVNQRMALTAKGDTPHLLHMTATPIPRSLTMTLYGDMDCSTLREKPAERLPITTRVIPLSRYDDIMERLKAALNKGEKVYWICPLIEEKYVEGELELTPEMDIAAAETRFTEFKTRFGNIVGLVHGKMKSDVRDKEMRRFAGGETRLLVATTVVEVGVDVRDATIIVIEKAERFGLSQLHQLRGRVGRGNKPSACVLLCSDRLSEVSQARLSCLRESEDGFKIAEADLQIRGGGDLLGSRQSGLPRFIFMDLLEHQTLLEQARQDAEQVLQADPNLTSERGKALQILLQLFGKE